MRLNDILKNKVVGNAGWIIGGKVFNKALAFVVGILSARYLGPGNYGLINYAAAYTAFFASLCTLGINSVLVKELIDYPEKEGETLGTTLVMRAASSMLSAVMIICITLFADRDEPLTILVVALYCVGMIFQVYDAFNYWFQAKLRSKYQAIAENIAFIVVSAFKILLLVLKKDVRWFAVAGSIDYITAAVILFAAYKKNGGPKFSFSWNRGKEILSVSSHFIISGLMVSIYASTDRFMLKQMLSEEVVGYYSLASSLSVSWAFVLAAIIDSMCPVIVQSRKENYKEYEQKNRILYAIVFYAALAASALICIFAKPIVEILYGIKYIPAIEPLRIIVWYTAFSYLGVARNPWMVCENKQKYLKYIYIGAAVINVLLNALLIPNFGAAGAAGASLVTQMATTVVLPFAIPALRPNAKLMVEAVCLKGVFNRKNKS